MGLLNSLVRTESAISDCPIHVQIMDNCTSCSCFFLTVFTAMPLDLMMMWGHLQNDKDRTSRVTNWIEQYQSLAALQCASALFFLCSYQTRHLRADGSPREPAWSNSDLYANVKDQEGVPQSSRDGIHLILWKVAHSCEGRHSAGSHHFISCSVFATSLFLSARARAG